MKKVFFSALLFFIVCTCLCQSTNGYKSLDVKQPVIFNGSYIVYKGDTITLGPKAFFIDGQLSDEEATRHSFVFNSINKAAEHLTSGTEEAPMVFYVAPYVYWIDNPDDTAVRVPKEGATPYGLIINCEWLKFKGLSDNAENVVLASNRGQTIGARGNFTMFRFIGQGTGSENITFGNYCNVDLVYPLLPKLSRKKRASAIVQAQLIHCNGDKIVARNTRFISRLNLCPFAGGKRVLFDNCHFESTDDALCSTGVYLNSTLDFYASKPFYNTSGTGAVFLNCDITSYSPGEQYFTKANGQVAVVDSRFKSKTADYWGWQDVVLPEARNYQYSVTLNNKPIFIGKNDPASTVEMSGKSVLDAYRIVKNGQVVYNTYNLLAGNDNWDPMEIKNVVIAAEKQENKKYTKLPTQLLISPARASVETKKHDVQLTAKINRFGNYLSDKEKIQWAVAPAGKSLVELQVSNDGLSCKVIPVNNNDDTRQVIVTASTASGLQAASVVTVAPSILEAPQFTSKPIISITNGKLHADYKLDMKFTDQSLVTWYRCTDAKGSNAIEVAVSRFNTPLPDYTLSNGDIGYYIMASVAPKHIRSTVGEAVTHVMRSSISARDVKTPANILSTDFKNVSTRNQFKVIPGFWTWDYLQPMDNDPRNAINRERDAWYYGEGSEGAAKMWGILQGRSAIMRYTPVGKRFGNMKLMMTVAPFKIAGQGFSVANLYMDVLIKFDTKTMTGYALRFIRTTKYHDAVDCIFVKYENGQVINISEPVSTTSFKTPCSITLEVNGSKLIAHVSTSAQNNTEAEKPNVVKEVNLETKINSNEFGGFGIQYNGGSPTLIKSLRAEWR